MALKDIVKNFQEKRKRAARAAAMEAALEKERARLQADPQGGSIGGDIFRLQAEIEQIKNSQNNKNVISN